MTRTAVMGSGSWGTAFAAMLADAGNDVLVWGRRQSLVDQISRGTNEDYLPGIPLPTGVHATTDVEAALADRELVVLAVPSQSLRENLTGWAPLLEPEATLLSLMKGVELGTTLRMSQVIAEVTGAPPERIAVLSGPNLAKEIASKQPAAGVVACASQPTADTIAAACMTRYFRVYTNRDVVGTELGGAVKNVVALAVGMAEGMHMGDNTKASIITRGLAEITRLGTHLGADPVTFLGLAGVGDLIATCMSQLSRNRTFGVNLGSGMSVAEVVAVTRQTAEGVKSCHAIQDLARRNGVEMPIVDAVVSVVNGERTPEELAELLMLRERKHERY
ncbi:MAG: NAD(P)H-dependent glycerol-3-phosphate dehydrogenase [Dermatophilaceae bacterium]